jgi:glycosyltransferase involved in cell wall biosynthesis
MLQPPLWDFLYRHGLPLARYSHKAILVLVDFIIPAFEREAPLKCMLASLQAQTCPDWHASVVIDDEWNDRLYWLVKQFNDSRMDVWMMSKRHNDWGHTPREWGKQRSEADYVIMTGDDNYYMPNFVAELKKAAEIKPGVIYWDMIHSHYDYQLFTCRPVFNQIDMGAFATRNDLAKQVELGKGFAADGEYIRDVTARFPKEKLVKINKVLFVHN